MAITMATSPAVEPPTFWGQRLGIRELALV
jgi:hypothetical protein